MSRAQHSLDQLAYLGLIEHGGGELAQPGPGDEDPARFVDPNFLDRRVVKVALQRSEAGDRVVDMLGDRVRVLDRGQGPAGGPLFVLGDHLIDDGPDHGRVDGRVQPAPSHQLADVMLDLVEHPPILELDRHGLPPWVRCGASPATRAVEGMRIPPARTNRTTRAVDNPCRPK